MTHETRIERTCPVCGFTRLLSNRPEVTGRCRKCVGWSAIKLAVEAEVDWVVVDRLVRGVQLRSTRAERDEAIRRLRREGVLWTEIATRIHCSHRSVERARVRLRNPEPEQRAA